jgi:hypothetical protein
MVFAIGHEPNRERLRTLIVISDQAYCALLVIIRPTSVMLRRHSATGEDDVSPTGSLSRKSYCACDSERPCQARAPPHMVATAEYWQLRCIEFATQERIVGLKELF